MSEEKTKTKTKTSPPGVKVASDGSWRNAKDVFVKGGPSPNPRGCGGRATNKMNTFKRSLMDAFDQLGGTAALVDWGRTHKTQFYRICARMIPLDVQLEASHKVMHVTMAIPPPHPNLIGSTPTRDGHSEQYTAPAIGDTTTRKGPNGEKMVIEYVGRDVQADAEALTSLQHADVPALKPMTHRDKEDAWMREHPRGPKSEEPTDE